VNKLTNNKTEKILKMSKNLIWAIDYNYFQTNFDSFFMFEPVKKPETYMRIEKDVAIVEIMGGIGRRSGDYEMDLVDSEILIDDILTAALDDDVKKIILHIDSPGGTVSGTKEVVQAVKEATQYKKVIAYTDGLMASAAYWIGSAASEIFATQTAQVGSIGVVASHFDVSERYKQMGVNKTYIFNGKFKRLVNEAEPLSKDGKEYLQKMVDDIYQIFANDVATNRRVAIEDIFKLESAIFLAAEAKEKGLIDGIKTNFKKEVLNQMDLKQLKADHADLYQEIYDKGIASVDIEKIKNDAIETERKRIIEIKESAFAGQESLIEMLISKGSTADEARKELIKAQKQSMEDGLKQISDSDPGDLGANDEPETVVAIAKDKTDAGNKLDDITKKIMAQKNCDYGQAFNQACAENPELTKIYNGK